MFIKTNHSTENKVDDVIDAFTNIYLHSMCVYMCTLLCYVYFLNYWLFRAMKSLTEWECDDFVTKFAFNCVEFYK